MAVSLFSSFLKQDKPLYRAYKKINKEEYQVYFSSKELADAHQEKLDKLSEKSEFWTLINKFIQSDEVRESCDQGGNIGIRHVYLRLNEVKKGSKSYYPAVQVSVAGANIGKVVIKDYPLSTYGWPNALYEAVKHSFEASELNLNSLDDNEADGMLNEALNWIERNEHALSDKLWLMIERCPHLVNINTEYSRNGTMMHIRLRIDNKGNLTLKSILPSFSRSKKIDSYSMLFHTAAYFTALQIIHREFKEQSSYDSYAAGIYFLLKGEWLTLLDKKGIGYQSDIDCFDYDYKKWKVLVNQWCVSEYGDSLLT